MVAGQKEDFDAERDNYNFQINLLNEQLERQTNRIAELERLLSAKNDLLRKTEVALERERGTAAALVQEPANSLLMLQSEIAQLKNRCANYEKENVELRSLLTPKTPKYLPLSPNSHHQHHQTPSPMSSTPDEDETRTPKTSFKKILGKIKRSNSGGHLANENGSRTTVQKKSLEDQQPPPQAFRRGGLRATAGGRLGWSGATNNQVLSRKAFNDWSTEVLMVWIDSLGLGMYNPEIKRYINSGDQLVSASSVSQSTLISEIQSYVPMYFYFQAKMSSADVENKIGIRNPMHRKKLSLAMKARQDTHVEAAQGGLDHHWVIRWLDDIGLPQYKDIFFDARIDGRVLNVLTVEDLLCHLKITNLLHHLSIRRGIQVLRQNNFAPDALKRRAIPGDSEAHNVSLWSNHRGK